MGNLSRKATLGVTALLIAATATIAVTGSAGATPAKTTAPASRAASVTVAAPAALAGAATASALVGPTSRAAVAASAAPAAANWPSRMYWPLVQRGARSVKVVNIQCLLRQWLRVWLPCNTRFSPATERYVRLFQRRHGLNPTGKVGPQTWPKLIVKVSYGSPYHLAVLAAQASLCMAYRYPILIDGIFGPQTLAAVKDFQRKYGLTPNGVVGPATWNKLVYFEW
ncbi:MAG TPA: peptidoglycan-binding protein [Trebonia sp.]|nr:peptidoglycan-binding protein [Trebonia sp.]